MTDTDELVRELRAFAEMETHQAAQYQYDHAAVREGQHMATRAADTIERLTAKHPAGAQSEVTNEMVDAGCAAWHEYDRRVAIDRGGLRIAIAAAIKRLTRPADTDGMADLPPDWEEAEDGSVKIVDSVMHAELLALSAAPPAGDMLMVPREPTEEMIEAAHTRLAGDGNVADIYKAMLSAAPPAKAVEDVLMHGVGVSLNGNYVPLDQFYANTPPQEDGK